MCQECGDEHKAPRGAKCKVVKARFSRKPMKSEVTDEENIAAKRSELSESTDSMLGACLIDGKVSESGAVKVGRCGRLRRNWSCRTDYNSGF